MFSGIYIKIAAAIAIGLFLWGLHYKIWHNGYTAHEQEVAIAQIKANNEAQEKYARISQDLETLKNMRAENAKVITKTVEKIVTRDVYHNNCIDSDGLSVANAALSGSSPIIPNATLPPSK